MEPTGFLILATAIFFLGLLGVLVRRNVFFVLMSIELMLNASNLLFITYSKMHGDLSGHVYSFFIMAVAAAEACVGLAIVILFFRKKSSIDMTDAVEMKN